MPVRGIAMDGDEPARVHRYARHLRAAPAARSGHGATPPGAAPATPTWWSLLVDAAKGSTMRSWTILAKLQGHKASRCLALNKVDRVKKERLLELAQAMQRSASRSTATFMISALNGDGVGRSARRYLARSVSRSGPGTIPADEVSDAPLAAAGVRDHAREDLRAAARRAALRRPPWRPRPGRRRRTACASSRRSSCSATARRRIVLGKGGRMIKQLSMQVAQGAVGDRREARAPLPVRQGARGLGGRPRALPRAWA